MRMIRFLPIFVCAYLISSPANAKPSSKPAMDRQSVEKAARKACLTGDYRKGVDILADLFVETKDTTYIFNQGRCFQQNHRWEDALDRFSEYLRKETSLPADEQAEVDRYIADCKAHLSEGLPPAQLATPSPVIAPAVQTSARVSAPTPTRDDVPTTVAASATESRPGSGLRMAGLVVGATGGAGVIAGVVLSLKAQSLTDQLNNRPKGSPYDQGTDSSRKTYQTSAFVGYGVGAAGILAGATLYLFSWRGVKQPAPTTRVSLIPFVGRDGSMLSLQGAFQ
jgi:hypothetical protein